MGILSLKKKQLDKETDCLRPILSEFNSLESFASAMQEHYKVMQRREKLMDRIEISKMRILTLVVVSFLALFSVCLSCWVYYEANRYEANGVLLIDKYNQKVIRPNFE